MTAPANTNTEDRALALLGSGVPASAVAAALGVTPGRISQLLANDEFADQVVNLKVTALNKHNDRDTAYDTMEDLLLTKLKSALPLLFRPADIAKTLQLINGAKRRGQSAPEQVVAQTNMVTVLLPIHIKQKYTTNIANQVVQAGDQSLITMQSGNLLGMIEPKEAGKELTHETLPSS